MLGSRATRCTIRPRQPRGPLVLLEEWGRQVRAWGWVSEYMVLGYVRGVRANVCVAPWELVALVGQVSERLAAGRDGYLKAPFERFSLAALAGAGEDGDICSPEYRQRSPNSDLRNAGETKGERPEPGAGVRLDRLAWAGWPELRTATTCPPCSSSCLNCICLNCSCCPSGPLQA